MEPRTALSNFHVIQKIKNEDIKNVTLVQKGTDRSFSVKRIVSIDPLYDLVKIEINEKFEDYLEWTDSLFPYFHQNKDIVLIGYPGGSFREIKRMEGPVYKYHDIYSFQLNSSLVHGASGSPIVSSGKLIGVTLQSDSNTIISAGPSPLKQFIKNQRGLSCTDQSLNFIDIETCVKKAQDNLASYKKGSDYALAQLRLVPARSNPEVFLSESYKKVCNEYHFAIVCSDIGAALNRFKRFEESIPFLEKACHELNYVIGCVQLGYAFSKLDRLEDAFSVLKKSCDRNSASGCNGLGFVLYRFERFEEALLPLRKSCYAFNDKKGCKGVELSNSMLQESLQEPTTSE